MTRTFIAPSDGGLRACGLLLPIALFLCAGCTVEMGEGDDPLLDTEQLDIVGNWSGPYSNGAWGPNPVGVPDGSKVCQAFDSRDQKWHPGKLHSTSCRYEYGGAGGFVKKTSGYYTLQGGSASVRWVLATLPTGPITGFQPGLMPICLSNLTNSAGKVWGGKCRYEWGDDAFSTTSFRYAVPANP